MLVLDDLHWADQPSLLLLQFLSRQHPLAEALAEALGELTRTQLPCTGIKMIRR